MHLSRNKSKVFLKNLVKPSNLLPQHTAPPNNAVSCNHTIKFKGVWATGFLGMSLCSLPNLTGGKKRCFKTLLCQCDVQSKVMFFAEKFPSFNVQRLWEKNRLSWIFREGDGSVVSIFCLLRFIHSLKVYMSISIVGG